MLGLMCDRRVRHGSEALVSTSIKHQLQIPNLFTSKMAKLGVHDANGIG